MMALVGQHGGNLNTVRNALAGAGTQTAGLAFGGEPTTAATEEYNGTSWASNPTGLNTARGILAGAGTQTATVGFGGDSVGGGGGKTAATEEWTGAGAPLTKTITVS
jgi:hypothetical protein